MDDGKWADTVRSISGVSVGTKLNMDVPTGEEEAVVLEGGTFAEQADEETRNKIKVTSQSACGCCFIFCSLKEARVNGN